MTAILSQDLYAPEVWADLATEQWKTKAIVGTSPAVLTSDELVGQPGDTINFPKWMLMSDMVDLAETDVLVPEKLTQKNSQATIKEAGKAAEWSDRAQLVGIGNVQDEALRQFGVLAARKVDADLIAEATKTYTGGITFADGSPAVDSKPLTRTITGGFTWNNLVDVTLMFGDEYDPGEFAGVYLRAEAAGTIRKDKDFISAAQTAQGNQMVRTGLLGQMHGLNFYITNRLPANRALLLKTQSLGLFYKRRPIVEQDRDILARTTVVATNLHYGVKRLKDDGVVDITIA